MVDWQDFILEYWEPCYQLGFHARHVYDAAIATGIRREDGMNGLIESLMRSDHKYCDESFIDYIYNRHGAIVVEDIGYFHEWKFFVGEYERRLKAAPESWWGDYVYAKNSEATR